MRIFPERVLRQTRIAYRTLAANKANTQAKMGSDNVRVAGYFTSSIGLGEAARRQSRFIASLNKKVVRLDLSDRIIPHRQRFLPNEILNNSSETNQTTIFHVNPPEMPKAIDTLGLDDNSYRIGYWVYELDRAPFVWRFSTRLVHEIWAPSKFAASALGRRMNKPVKVMPLPIDLVSPNKKMREKLGIPSDVFVVLLAFDVNSTVSRKNPYSSIRAFQTAFQNEESVRLIIKVSGLENWTPAAEQLSQLVSNDPNIIIISEVLSEADMSGLIIATDVVISLHRSEGFGLLLAEAMAREKAVVATGWSGNMEFMNEETALLVPYTLIDVNDRQNEYGAGKWADPDFDEAVDRLKFCFANVGELQKLGKRAKQYVDRVLGTELREKYVKNLFP